MEPNCPFCNLPKERIFLSHEFGYAIRDGVSCINLTKKDSIPDVSYIRAVALLHHTGLLTIYNAEPNQSSQNEANQYLSDLNLRNYEDLLNEDLLTEIYIQTYNPLIEITLNSGFSGRWLA
jgi:hypothetical protein